MNNDTHKPTDMNQNNLNDTDDVDQAMFNSVFYFI